MQWQYQYPFVFVCYCDTESSIKLCYYTEQCCAVLYENVLRGGHLEYSVVLCIVVSIVKVLKLNSLSVECDVGTGKTAGWCLSDSSSSVSASLSLCRSCTGRTLSVGVRPTESDAGLCSNNQSILRLLSYRASQSLECQC